MFGGENGTQHLGDFLSTLGQISETCKYTKYVNVQEIGKETGNHRNSVRSTYGTSHCDLFLK